MQTPPLSTNDTSRILSFWGRPPARIVPDATGTSHSLRLTNGQQVGAGSRPWLLSLARILNLTVVA